jgi:hypothetical protein
MDIDFGDLVTLRYPEGDDRSGEYRILCTRDWEWNLAKERIAKGHILVRIQRMPVVYPQWERADANQEDI